MRQSYEKSDCAEDLRKTPVDKLDEAPISLGVSPHSPIVARPAPIGTGDARDAQRSEVGARDWAHKNAGGGETAPWGAADAGHARLTLSRFEAILMAAHDLRGLSLPRRRPTAPSIKFAIGV